MPKLTTLQGSPLGELVVLPDFENLKSQFYQVFFTMGIRVYPSWLSSWTWKFHQVFFTERARVSPFVFDSSLGLHFDKNWTRTDLGQTRIDLSPTEVRSRPETVSEAFRQNLCTILQGDQYSSSLSTSDDDVVDFLGRLKLVVYVR